MTKQSWLDGLFENRSWLGLVQYNAITGSSQVAGTDIPATLPYAWADFIALTWTDLDGKFFRVTDKHSVGATGGSIWQADAVGNRPVLISGPLVFANVSDFPSAVTYPGLRCHSTVANADYTSNGTIYELDGGEAVISRSAVAQRVVAPAATFTAVTPTSAAAGSDTTLTSAGAHGLTTAICVTAGDTYIYISGGTNWTVGLHKITAVTESGGGLIFQIDTPWNAEFGTPTIALAGTEFVIQKITVPPMTVNGYLELSVTWGSTSGTGTKQPTVRFGASGSGISGTAYYNPAAVTNTRLGIRPAAIVIQNRGSESSQVGALASVVQSLLDVTNTALPTSSVNTSLGTAELNIGALMASANDPIWIDRYILKMGT